MRKQSLTDSNYRKAKSCGNCARIYYSVYGPNKQIGSWCSKHKTLISKNNICDDHKEKENNDGSRGKTVIWQEYEQENELKFNNYGQNGEN